MVAHGSTFSTRERARGVAAAVDLVKGELDVTVDFSGVRAISYSFADEFVRAMKEVMLREHLATLHLTGSDPAVQEVFRQILERRQLADHQPHGLNHHQDTTILIGAT